MEHNAAMPNVATEKVIDYTQCYNKNKNNFFHTQGHFPTYTLLNYLFPLPMCQGKWGTLVVEWKKKTAMPNIETENNIYYYYKK